MDLKSAHTRDGIPFHTTSAVDYKIIPCKESTVSQSPPKTVVISSVHGLNKFFKYYNIYVLFFTLLHAYT